jgi:integrase/recombinase XerD
MGSHVCSHHRPTGRGGLNPASRDPRTVHESYLHERVARPGQALFPGPHGHALSADAVQQRLALHVTRATTSCPGLAGKHVTVHTLRHTAAMRFLEAGIDTAVIALWLGHETIATTSIYLHADMNLKRAALDRTRQPNTPAGDYQPGDPLITWLQSL